MADEMQFWKQGYSIASLESFGELANCKQCFADDKVCVVGLFGNGRSGVQGKAFYANSAVERNVFQAENFFKMTNSDPCEIEIFHDVEQRTLYLHLETVHDGAMLCKLCEILNENIPLAEAHTAWQHQEYQYAKALLFMFSVCHIMVLMHPTQTFDVSYIRLFKLVANTRQQLITILSQELSGVEGIHDIWKQTGRPCIPRLLCSFQQNKNSQLLSRNVSEVESNPDSYASRTKIKSQTPAKSPLTNLQHALEDQVYSIMRKSRLLGSLSSSSLFTVTSSHNFVHVQAAEISRSADTLDLLVKKFPFPALPDSFRSALFPKPPQNTTPLDSSTNSGHMLFRDFLREQIDNLMTGDGRDGLAEGRRGTHVEVPTIGQWAKVCVSVFGYLMSDRSNENNHMVSLSANLDLDMKFSDARCRKVLPVASSAYLDNLPSHYPESVHINQLNQALRVFAMNARGPAYEKYVLQLQDDCNKVWINGRQLCEVRSLKGRHCIYPFHTVPGQQIADSPLIDKSTISCKPHSSRITSTCACNCGRTQAQREDPFDLKAANYDFYQTMEEKCCSTLVHLSFPCYPFTLHEKTASTDSNDVLPVPPVLPVAETEMSDKESVQGEATFPTAPVRLNKDAKEFVSNLAKTPTTPTNVTDIVSVTNPESSTTPASITDPASVPNASNPASVPNASNPASVPNASNPASVPNASNPASVANASNPASVPNASNPASVPNPASSLLSEGFHSMSELESNYQKSATSFGFHGNSSAGETEHLSGDTYQGEEDEIRQSSTKKTADYLECMLSSEPTGGRLPLFCSWSLCRLGNANTYQVSKGLDQKGFFPGSNFLLPWDIPLLNENQAGLSSYIDGHVKHPGVKTAGVEAWPAPNELPNANSNTALPLYQTLVYASRQCTDYKVNPLPICAAPTGGSKGNAARNQRRQYPTVRTYIGNEYECARGHRFICSADDKMVKANNSGVVKETAVRLVDSDMPLYFPCPCRTSKPFLAQLTRLFVVTPESPILITLNPRVQPAPAPCPVFYLGIKSGITLPPASLCVLRLPFVYVGLEGPISHPAENQPLMNSRLLRGTYGVMATERLFEDKEAWS